MSRPWCSAQPTGVRLSVQITPNAKKNEVTGELSGELTGFDDVLKIKLHAQPIEGKANDALIRFIAERLSLPRSAVSIAQGHLNRHKLLDIHSPGLTAEAAKQALLPERQDFTGCSRTPA